MFRITLILAMNFIHAHLNQAPCIEDSHCSIGFFCEETALYCRKCLNCGDYQRESPLQQDLCIKSVVQCGECLKGLIVETGNEKTTGCVSYVGVRAQNHPYLPPYAWAAIAVGLFLMLLTVCVLLKAKMFKVVSYSLRTSVHSLRATEAADHETAAPPPYNYHLPLIFPPRSAATEMPEMHRLVDSRELSSKSCSESHVRPREAVGNQEARVFSNPAYVRIPQNPTIYNTPEETVSETEMTAVPVAYDANTSGHVQSTGNITKFDNETTDDQRCESTNSPQDSTQRRSGLVACAKVEDDNNNYPSESGREPKSGAYSGARLIAGPSFVINVVENISSLHQTNHANCYHTDPS